MQSQVRPPDRGPRPRSRCRPGRLAAAVVVSVLVAGACSGGGDTAPPTSPAPDSAGGTTTTLTTGTDPGVTWRATIRRTTDGVPHVVADDLGSVGFGYGYALAEDHLCTLVDLVVGARGERARWHGPGPDGHWLNSDIVMAALDVPGRAATVLEDLDPDIVAMLEGYAAGASAYLDDVGADAVPGWCRGAEWLQPVTATDLVAYFLQLSLRASIDPMIDFIARAAPPASGDGQEAVPAPTDETAGAAFDGLVAEPDELASNGWAIGPERTVGGTTMLVGNPHFPWQGGLRFYEAHLTVPGVLDVYGASLIGSPAINIGFTPGVAWTHTVSAGNRFTAYTLDLVPGDPTRYRYGDTTRSLTPVEVTVEVADPGTGEVTSEDHTVWFSHYGPVLDFPGVGWTTERTITVRDANADNTEIIDQYFAMNRARTMDEFIEAHRTHQGIPWVNTIAASADGRLWYADTSATPNLSDEAIAAWLQRVGTDPLTRIALDNRVVLLDGSDPLFEWVDEPGARDPGLVPFDAMPQLERRDYVFNANDPYWLANPDELLDGPYSPLHGRARRPVSMRTRANVAQLQIEGGDAGPDGLFSLDELAASAVGNRVYSAELLADEVLARCHRYAAMVDAPLGADPGRPCRVLEDWDRRADLDSRGAILWREFMATVDLDPLWAVPFDPADPAHTPRELVPPEVTDPVVDALLAAVDRLDAAGIPLDAPLGDWQWAPRGDERVPVHGGPGRDGITNVVTWGGNSTTTEPAVERPERVAGSPGLTVDGYPVTYGTSFLYALEFTADGPVARSLLTYSGTGDPDDPRFAAATRRFAARDWKPIAFTDEAIAADPELTTEEVSR